MFLHIHQFPIYGTVGFDVTKKKIHATYNNHWKNDPAILKRIKIDIAYVVSLC